MTPPSLRDGINHLSFNAGVDFAFLHLHVTVLNTVALPLGYNRILRMVGFEPTIANLQRCATPVASQPFELQNTTHLISFALRATQRSFTNPVIPSSFRLLYRLLTLIIRLYNYVLVFGTHQFGMYRYFHHRS